MALSALQTEYIFELLNVPPGSTVYKIDEMGLNATLIVGTGPLSSVTAINALIASLNASQQAIVTNILNDYINIVDATKGMSFQNSQISQNVNGFTLNFREAEEDYKRRLKHYLPFWDTFETRQTQASAVANMKTAVARVLM